jgi:hypothetical protein
MPQDARTFFQENTAFFTIRSNRASHVCLRRPNSRRRPPLRLPPPSTRKSVGRILRYRLCLRLHQSLQWQCGGQVRKVLKVCQLLKLNPRFQHPSERFAVFLKSLKYMMLEKDKRFVLFLTCLTHFHPPRLWLLRFDVRDDGDTRLSIGAKLEQDLSAAIRFQRVLERFLELLERVDMLHRGGKRSISYEVAQLLVNLLALCAGRVAYPIDEPESVQAKTTVDEVSGRECWKLPTLEGRRQSNRHS